MKQRLFLCLFVLAWAAASPALADYFLTNTASTISVPAAGQSLTTVNGSNTGFNPSMTIPSSPYYWYSAPITGSFSGGDWKFVLWTDYPGCSAVVTVEIGLENTDGSGFTELGSVNEDVNTPTNTGNHSTTFDFGTLAQQNFSGQVLVVEISQATSATCPAIMAYSGSFPTALVPPALGALGTATTAPSATPSPTPTATLEPALVKSVNTTSAVNGQTLTYTLNYKNPNSAVGNTCYDTFETGQTQWPTGWTSPTGGTWGLYTGTNPNGPTDPGTQSLQASSTGGFNYTTINCAGSVTDGQIQADVQLLQVGDAQAGVTLLWRQGGSSTYQLHITSGSSSNVSLRVITNGGYNQIALGSYTINLATWYTLKFEVSGFTLQGYINGTLVLSATDPNSTYNAGAAGVEIDDGDSVGINALFDNVIITNNAITWYNVNLVDTLPAGVTYVSDSCGGTMQGQVWSLNVGTLAPGTGGSCSIVTTVNTCPNTLVNQGLIGVGLPEVTDYSNDVTTTVSCFSPTPTGSPSQTSTNTSTASPSASPTATSTVSPTDTATASPTNSPTPTFTASPTATFTASPILTPTDSPTATPTITQTVTFTASPTQSDSPTATPTATQTVTFTASPTQSDSPTATPTATQTVTFTASPTQSDSPTATPTATQTVTFTASPTQSDTSTPTPTATQTVTFTASPTQSDTSTPTPTATQTVTFTASPTASYTPTVTPSSTQTLTYTLTPTSTQTVTTTDTRTCTSTYTDTSTYTYSPTVTDSPTVTPTPIPVAANVTVSIYNSAGELVKVLFQGGAESVPTNFSTSGKLIVVGSQPVQLNLNTVLSNGQSAVAWNGTNANGQSVSSGVYYFQVVTKDNFGKLSTYNEPIQVLGQQGVGGDQIGIFNNAGEVVWTGSLPAGADSTATLTLEHSVVALTLDPTTGKLATPMVIQVGSSAVSWNGCNLQNAIVAPGVYLVRLTGVQPGGASVVQTKQIELIASSAGQASASISSIAPNPWRESQPLMVAYTPAVGVHGAATIYSLTGQRLATASDPNASGTVVFPVLRYPAGIYLLEFRQMDSSNTVARSLSKFAIIP